MEVIITKKHCENTCYISTTDCPLFRAIKEQYPEFPLVSVGGLSITDKNKNKHYFNSNKWNYDRMLALMQGEIKIIILTIRVMED